MLLRSARGRVLTLTLLGILSLPAALVHCGDSAQPGAEDVDAGIAPNLPGPPSKVEPDAGASARARDDAGRGADASADAAVVDAGVLGDGSITPLTARTIFAGSMHTCVLRGGKVKCWGYNYSGQLGTGTGGATASKGDEAGEMGLALQSVDLGVGRSATSLALGTEHTCALLDNGDVKCWGANDDGELGQDDTLARGDEPGELGAALAPVNLGIGRKATAIAAGRTHSCALLDDGSVKCWGANGNGQLGQGDTVNRGDKAGAMASLLPIPLPPGRTALRVRAGGQTTCLLLDDKSVRCLGFNLSGQLGLGDTFARGGSAAQVGAGMAAADLGPGTVADVTAGTDATCASFTNGKIKCWGGNLFGQLGIGASGGRGTLPSDMGAQLLSVDLGPGVLAAGVVEGSRLSCALLNGGKTKCWGANGAGQLGLGDSSARGTQPTQMGAALPSPDVGAGRTVVELSAGSAHVCVRLDDGAYKCWGENTNGKLGLGDTKSRGLAPADMGNALPAIDVGP